MSETNNVKKPFTLPAYLLHAVIPKPSDAPAAGIYTVHLDDGDRGMYVDETQPDILQLGTFSRRSGESFDLSEPGDDVIGGTDSGLQLREVPEISHKLYGVGMNQAREVLVSAANVGGGMGTKALSGCTGLAGCAELPDGSAYVLVSHVDPMADAINRINGKKQTVASGTSRSDGSLVTFLAQAKKRGATNIRVAVAYDAVNTANPDYGQTSTRAYDDWHFLDQVQNTLRSADTGVRWAEIPYQADTGSTLVVENTSHGYSMRFDGQEIDFNTSFQM